MMAYKIFNRRMSPNKHEVRTIPLEKEVSMWRRSYRKTARDGEISESDIDPVI